MWLSKAVSATLLVVGTLHSTLALGQSSDALEARQASSSYWVANIQRQGAVPFGEAGYKVYRNVKDFGARGDGTTDDTAAINKAVQDGNRCISGCDSKTNAPALVYFPPGTYVVSSPIIQTYYTQFIGDAVSPPTLKASSTFKGMAVIDANPYGDGGFNWYINQNNFFRQVRNFVIDITGAPADNAAGIHWQVSQATSLQNIVINMRNDPSPANEQKGLFIENGSGGFITDLTINGGGFGVYIGSQQFTVRNVTINGSNTGVYAIWNWLLELQGMSINNCQIAVDMSSGGPEEIKAGSLLFLDSKITGTPVGVNTLYRTDIKGTNNTMIIDNVDMSQGVSTAIRYAGDNSTILAGGRTVAGFAQGRSYNAGSGKAVQTEQAGIQKPEGLLKDGRVFTRSKPQYEGLPASSFVSVKSAGAKGDGKTDDTAAIQNIFDNYKEGQVIYFDHGAYLIMDTVKVPKNIKITGESWPLIMAAGKKFNDQTNPQPVLQVGNPGDVGTVEMSDLMIETMGPQAGAILVQWNLAGSSPGDAGLWDVHFRVGGTAGTQLQSDKCAKNPNVTAPANPECMGAFMMFHATKTASVYVENCWFWVADHELDLVDHSQINIYNGRGVLIESQNPVWLWGTASEHSQLYNYQISNARNVWMGVIQTETAYMQGNPDANTPFTVNEGFSDPDFKASCTDGSDKCARTWGLRVTNSSDVFMFGGGLYSFFDNYDQECLKTEACQDNIISVEDSNVHMFGFSTKASINMLTHDGKSVALDKDNRNTFCAAVAEFETNGGTSGADGGSGSGSGSGSSSASLPVASPTVRSSTVSSGSVGATGPSVPVPTQTPGSGSGGGSGSGAPGTSVPAPTQTPASGPESGSGPGVSSSPAGAPPAVTTLASNSPGPSGSKTDADYGGAVTVTVTVTATGACGSE